MDNKTIICANPECGQPILLDQFGDASSTCPACNHVFFVAVGETINDTKNSANHMCYCGACCEKRKQNEGYTTVVKEIQLIREQKPVEVREHIDTPHEEETREPTLEETKARLAEIREERMSGRKKK